MRKIRCKFIKYLPVFAAAALALAAFSACSHALPAPVPREQAESAAPVSSAPEPKPAFASYEEAEEAIYSLRRTRFESGVYVREQVAAFDDACYEAVQYLRHNKEDADYLQKCCEYYEKMRVACESVEYRKGDVPRVYITVTGEIPADRYVRCIVSFVDKEGGVLAPVKDTSATVRVRGNSTAEAEKKPYNIKLSSDMSVLGMESGTKWALLANHFDKTLIRNKLALDLAFPAGCYAALDSRFAEVFLNGKLVGSYLVCEPVTDGKHRTGIDPGSGDFIAERVKLWSQASAQTVVTRSMGLRFDLEYCSDLKRAERILNAAEEAILSGDEALIRERIDVDSFAGMYILHELLKDCDLTYGSTYLCCVDGVLYFGPLWDMDLSAGNVSYVHGEEKYQIYNNVPPFGDGSGDSARGVWARQEWFEKLCECRFFMDAVRKKFDRMSAAIEDLYVSGGCIDRLETEYGASFDRNYAEAGWDISAHASPYESAAEYASRKQAVEELRDWLRRRHDFLKSELE